MVLVVLFEADKLLLYQDAPAVMHMVRLHLVQELTTVPVVPSVLLGSESTLRIAEACNTQQQHQPIIAILHEIKVTVVVHGVGGFTHFEVYSIARHVSFEFDGVLASDQVVFLMVVVQMVVDCGLMELAGRTQSRSSQSATALLR